MTSSSFPKTYEVVNAPGTAIHRRTVKGREAALEEARWASVGGNGWSEVFDAETGERIAEFKSGRPVTWWIAAFSIGILVVVLWLLI